MKILYVEDEADIRELACLSLVDFGGHDVVEFSSGREALEAAHDIERPDLILLDVMMPEIDGTELYLKLHALPKFKDIPTVFMTAKTMPKQRKELFDLGAIGVVAKPFDPVSLPVLLEEKLLDHALAQG